MDILAQKKCRRPIGSMIGTEVRQTQLEDHSNANSGSEGSSSHIDGENSHSHNSSSDDSDNDETQNAADNNNEVVRRGPTKMGFEWGTGKVMQLQLNSADVVIGSNACFFSSQLGILAKDGNKLPLCYTDWRAVPTMQKNLVWAEVKENTNLPDNYKNNCLKKLGKLWKDWKNRLKAKYYTPHRHDKKFVLSKYPERVEADQWPVLVNYWSSKNAKKLSKTNKNSRKHVKLPPRLGRRDMANAIEEYRREYGSEPSKLDLFVYTRQNKNGKPLDKDTEEKITILKVLKQKLPENLRDDISANDEIFQDVIGNDAPGCLGIVASKRKNIAFTTREEFDRAVQEKSNDVVANIQKGFDDHMQKFTSDYSSKIEMLQARLFALEGQQNEHVSGSVGSRRIQAFNNRSSFEELMNIETSNHANDVLQTREEMYNSNENNINTQLDDSSLKDKGTNATKKNKKQRK